MSAVPLFRRHRAGGAALGSPRRRRLRAVVDAVVIALAVLGVALLPNKSDRAAAATAPAGQGFTVTPADLAFILKQIRIAEHHAATQTASNPCGTLVGPGPEQIPDRLTSYGLRTVDGSCNNLFPGRETFATADQPFPRLTAPLFKDAENVNNTDSPWVDQSQTYTSHASHQVFLREYAMTAGKPVDTGKLLGGMPG